MQREFTEMQRRLKDALALVDDVRAIMVDYGDTTMTEEIDKAIASHALHMPPKRLRRPSEYNQLRKRRKGART